MSKDENASAKTKSRSKLHEWVRFIVIIILVFGTGYIVFNYVPFVAKYDTYVIKTDSMVPVINVGDIVVVDSSVKADQLKPGDIIAFYADINGDGKKEVVVHYLKSISTVDGVTVYRTDSEKTTLDEWVLKSSDILGKEAFRIPKIGPIIMFSQSTIGRIVLITDILVLFAIIEYFSRTKKTKKEINHKDIQAILYK